MSNYTYYLSANSCGGYTSFFDEYKNDYKKIIVLKNISKSSKSNLYKKIKSSLNNMNISYDIVMRCGSSDEFDAVILNDLSTVIADEYLFTGDIPLYADIVNFLDESDYDFTLRKKVNAINNQIDVLYGKMFSHLKDAKHIHDEWEKIYISNMDFEKMDNAVDGLIENIFNKNTSFNDEHEPRDVKRFFGTLLPRDSIEYIDELTENISKRIFIKGRPGTGKSTMLKKIISAAHSNGYDTETYYCSFDCNSLDMVVIRDLGVAVFDSTSPHEKFPFRENDIIFDVYEIAVNPATDELYSDELMHITNIYNSEIKKAKECLYTALVLRNKCGSYIDSDTEHVNNCLNKVMAFASLDE